MRTKLGNKGEEHRMRIQADHKVRNDRPSEPDDNWWAAVLADEPKIEEEVEPGLSSAPVEPVPLESASPASIKWGKVQDVFNADGKVALNVVGFNRGGLLVANADMHGFVPLSHLIDLPADVEAEQRESYLADYLEREIHLKIIECEQDKERIVFSERAALAGEGQRQFLLQTLQPGDIVTGVVTNVTEFGVFVDLGGLEGLIHISELSWGRVQHPAEILKVGDEVTPLILEVSEEKGRIALSTKRLLENPWDKLQQSCHPGDCVSAVITTIVKYGAFARLSEGVEGLIHISSMNFPENCYRIDDFLFEGQDVVVKILQMDTRKCRLGLKLESYSIN